MSANLKVLKGFKGHQLHPVLSSPGSADLTADVDFSYLRRAAGGGVACMGPITQRAFLKNMGIDARMQASGSTEVTSDPRHLTSAGDLPLCRSFRTPQVLLRSCRDAAVRKQLIGSYEMLTSPAHMGERFLFFSLLSLARMQEPSRPAGGLQLDRKKRPAPLPVAGFTPISFS